MSDYPHARLNRAPQDINHSYSEALGLGKIDVNSPVYQHFTIRLVEQLFLHRIGVLKAITSGSKCLIFMSTREGLTELSFPKQRRCVLVGKR